MDPYERLNVMISSPQATSFKTRKPNMAKMTLDSAILRFSDTLRFGLLYLLLVGIVSGCATLDPNNERVKVTIANITPLESTLMEQRFLVKLRIQNRSQKPMTIDGMSFDLELNGKDFASGVSNQRVTASAYDEAMLDIKVSSTIFGVIRQIQSVQELNGKPFHYEISGALNSPDSFFTVRFRERGEIDLGIPGDQPTDKGL